LGSLTVI